MYIAQRCDSGTELTNVTGEHINDELLVFEGDCTCCSRQHSGMVACDKETLRDVFVGIYADVLWSHEHSSEADASVSSPISAVQAQDVIGRIQQQKSRIFPQATE